MVLALTPVFLDERFSAERSPATLELLERLARKAIAVAGTPDAGIWEYRTEWKPQTFSSLMCWAAADRMARVAARHAPDAARASSRRRRSASATRSSTEAWNARARQPSSATYGGDDLDASLLQMAHAALPARRRSAADAAPSTPSARTSRSDGWLFRYRHDDGFGKPDGGLHHLHVLAGRGAGRDRAARAEAKRASWTASHRRCRRSGCSPRTTRPSTLRMWGNFPQAYSHVGLIHAAFAASPRWADIL